MISFNISHQNRMIPHINIRAVGVPYILKSYRILLVLGGTQNESHKFNLFKNVMLPFSAQGKLTNLSFMVTLKFNNKTKED